ncbi:TetR family transcriptional regulator [Actinomycetospora cinnamomea]|uniref:TetR family transcriptional regulator n=1 Tax=Actinomycetospora cinnamomea TaxID=663609 RepID=A0A2U1FM31_9PSEU|nr:TetR family transcriptional regulator [Actinomycetospora cinnamomea]
MWGDDLGEVPRTLLDSAVRCFAERGFHATTTRDVSAGAGLSPAALYVHFPSKEAVLYEITRRGHESALAVVRDPAVTDIPEAATRLRAIVAAFVAWHARHHVVARVCQYELASLTAEHHEDIRRLRRRFNTVFRDAVVTGTAQGVFATGDVDRVVRAMLSLGIDLVRWYRLGGADSPEDLGAFYGELAVRMVTAGA